MRQLHFILNSLDHGELIHKSLCDAGIHNNQIKFVSRDKPSLSRLRVNSASFLEERDVVHMMMRGGLFCLLLSTASVWGLNSSGLVSLGVAGSTLVIVFLTMFGTWVGGMIGFNHDNYKLAAYHDDLLQGEAVLVVTARPEQESVIQRVMMAYANDVHYVNRAENVINPLHGGRLVHHTDDWR
ncbi:hypothetical protein ACFSJ3_13570 [Corallincola platygyrae]|uniref:Uncharacterized protein n=1 Tax=Corallincola platygyrae TaxID=1193278 RepID=A0ABW4XN51_9GAMM